MKLYDKTLASRVMFYPVQVREMKTPVIRSGIETVFNVNSGTKKTVDYN